MNFNELKFKETTMPAGVQANLFFEDGYELSIVKNTSSYGNAQGLYEIAVFKGNDQVEMPGVTEEGDTVKGFLTEEGVTSIIKKMFFLTGGSEPVQKDV